MSEATATIIPFPGRRSAPGFTVRDLSELLRWDGGCLRIEVSPVFDELGQFALVFADGQPWASHAISRESGQYLLWDCRTHADLGHFGSLGSALGAIPRADQPGLPEPALAASAHVLAFQLRA